MFLVLKARINWETSYCFKLTSSFLLVNVSKQQSDISLHKSFAVKYSHCWLLNGSFTKWEKAWRIYWKYKRKTQHAAVSQCCQMRASSGDSSLLREVGLGSMFFVGQFTTISLSVHHQWDIQGKWAKWHFIVFKPPYTSVIKA